MMIACEQLVAKMELPSIHTHGEVHARTLQTLFTHLATVYGASVGRDAARRHLRAIAQIMAPTLEERYMARLHGGTSLSQQEFFCLLPLVAQEFSVTLCVHPAHAQGTLISLERCPCEEIFDETPGLCYVISCIIGILAAQNWGAAWVCHEEGMTGSELTFGLRLTCDPSPTVLPARGELFLREEDKSAVARDTVPAEPASATPWDYESLYHHQVALTTRLEQMLAMERAAAEQLRSFNRLKHDFLSNVSHEFRTPITAIQGYLTLLGQRALGPLEADQQEAIEIAQRNIDRLSRLVSDVLDFSSLVRGQCQLAREVVDMAEVVDAALLCVAEVMQRKGIQVQRTVADALGQVNGDREKLQQCLAHLLENAIKFSEPEQEILLTAYSTTMQVCVEVTDAGIGMTPEQLRQVFTPFVQGESGLSRRYGGLGMGLSLIQNVLALHDGEIRIFSEPGQGTCVRVTLPRSDEPASRPAPKKGLPPAEAEYPNT
ncbi:MAG TPA: HAMP domain-containing sensor histidine kinase [Armatimonadota bacterium]|jgi:signal transduction histidine kinase